MNMFCKITELPKREAWEFLHSETDLVLKIYKYIFHILQRTKHGQKNLCQTGLRRVFYTAHLPTSANMSLPLIRYTHAKLFLRDITLLFIRDIYYFQIKDKGITLIQKKFWYNKYINCPKKRFIFTINCSVDFCVCDKRE